MKKWLVLWFAACLAMGMMVGCGEPDDENNGGNGGGGELYAGVADEDVIHYLMADMLCEAGWQCFGDSTETLEFFQYAPARFESEAECKSYFQQERPFGDAAEYNQALAEGRLVIDRSHARACKNAVRDIYCSGEPAGPMPEACAQFFVGQVAEGGACLDDMECSGTNECHSLEDACYGECAPSDYTPGLCGGEVCAAGEFCLEDWDSSTQDWVESCEPVRQEGDDCSWRERCAEGLTCSQLRDVCIPLVVAQPGEDCDWGETFCTPGHRCLVPEDFDFSTIPEESLAGSCAPIGQTGDRCFADIDCKFGLECLDDDDDYFGVCGVRELAADGEDCDYDYECESGYCDWDTDTCAEQEFLADGEPCFWDGECESDFCGYDPMEDDYVCMPAELNVCELPEDGDSEE